MQKKHPTLKCPKCKSTNVYGVSRVVGYYSIIENWNESKQAELSDRQKGRYKLQGDIKQNFCDKEAKKCEA